jgi:hypothetical protein
MGSIIPAPATQHMHAPSSGGPLNPTLRRQKPTSGQYCISVSGRTLISRSPWIIPSIGAERERRSAIDVKADSHTWSRTVLYVCMHDNVYI